MTGGSPRMGAGRGRRREITAVGRFRGRTLPRREDGYREGAGVGPCGGLMDAGGGGNGCAGYNPATAIM